MCHSHAAWHSSLAAVSERVSSLMHRAGGLGAQAPTS